MQSPASASLGNLLTPKPSAPPTASLFKKAGLKKLYNAVHDTNNPLNWFQRMKQRQMEKPILLNSNVAQIHRTIETREQAMVAKSGSGNQREVGRLAAMNDRDYYKQYSGVLNLARSNPVLIQKIREASVPDNSMESGLTKETKEAVLEGGSEGGEGAAAAAGGEDGAAAAEEAPMVGGGGGASSAASASTTVVVPESVKEFVAATSSIPEPENPAYRKDKGKDIPIEVLTARYGPVPGSGIGILTAVALGDMPAEEEAKRKSLEYIRDVLKIEIGSRKFWNLVAYEARGLTEMPEEEYKGASEELFTKHPELKPVKHLATSKKALDEAVAKSVELDVKQLQKILTDARLNTVLENALLPLKSGDKNTVRDGFNFVLKELTTATTTLKAARPEAAVDWPDNIEIRKGTNANKIGDIFIEGQQISAYVNTRKEDPSLLRTIPKIRAFFDIIRDHLRNSKSSTGVELTTPRTEKEMKAFVDLEYPLLGGIFENILKQIDDSMKILRPKASSGGKTKGTKNRPKKAALITAELAASGGAAAPAASAESADTSNGDEEA